MQITSQNLRQTTREYHRPTRSYRIIPRGNGLAYQVVRRMPTINAVPSLWV